MSTGSASASTEEFIEILNAEQLVDLQKLRDYARHGVQPAVRGEVWLYLLGVLSDDKSQEMTSVRSKYLEYDSLDKHNAYLEKRIRNESARYYQRKLIARPPPGRTLTRSSQRLSSRSYPNSRNQDTTNGSALQFTQNGSTSDPIKGSASTTTTPLNRGPNRVQSGRSRMLAGIMGSSSIMDSSSISTEDDGGEELLMDPEAAAGSEMKRFCAAVEHVVCAHLNQWRWKETEVMDHAMGKDEPNQTLQQPSPPSAGQVGSSAQDISCNQASLQQDYSFPQPHTQLISPSDHEDDGKNNRSRASTLSLSSSNPKTPGISVRTGEDVKATSKTGSNLFPLLPKEYQWAHQPAEVSATSTLFTLDSGSIHSDQYYGQLAQPDYHPDLILLCAPFVKCIRVEAGMYFAFAKLMSMREEYYARHPLSWQISTFLTLFRTTLPELHAYFDEEEVDMIGLASAWLRHLLAAEMRIEDLLRLWDTYFAVPDPMDLHMYVCIAVLTNCKDALEELDQSEAKSMLSSLPPLDVDRILNEAVNIRLSHRQSDAVQESM